MLHTLDLNGAWQLRWSDGQRVALVQYFEGCLLPGADLGHQLGVGRGGVHGSLHFLRHRRREAGSEEHVRVQKFMQQKPSTKGGPAMGRPP